ncbi:transcriptional regulator, HxlR family [Enhydrobacter aerosaccus]|uniref:Transcriptional regulator, HxlR family n=1 Tax=Enhydrobacter aerosaccus TaxID=225324 RepID=A0A1T4RLQ6_9HYPH|nr:helix-turn-helix domain-containing protein [Enhydrobacter aerosaccus]SKA16930.1 transcriptional regulator, HxlR family [Enhydrobacter aerosaccus]
MTKPLRPGKPARGSASGRPIMVLLDLLGRRWTLRLLWELREKPRRFRALQDAIGASPAIVNERLRELRDAKLVVLDDTSGYCLTSLGGELVTLLLPLHVWSEKWARHLPK